MKAKRNSIIHSERRWALLADAKSSDPYFLGKYDWFGPVTPDPEIRTFRTRAEAQLAKRQGAAAAERARIVPVEVITKEIGRE